ncbi:MAG: hypothetical protein WCO57_13930 [Verrucomicrobiota bacterium]
MSSKRKSDIWERSFNACANSLVWAAEKLDPWVPGGMTYIKIGFQQKGMPRPFCSGCRSLEQMNVYTLKVTGLKPGQHKVRLGGVKVADYSAAQLGTGVNLAAAVLAAGPIADQVVAAAASTKNSYFHDRIFGGVLRAGGVPDFMEITPEQVEAKRTAVFNERMKKMPELFEAIQKARVMHAHQVEIVGAK